MQCFTHYTREAQEHIKQWTITNCKSFQLDLEEIQISMPQSSSGEKDFT